MLGAHGADKLFCEEIDQHGNARMVRRDCALYEASDLEGRPSGAVQCRNVWLGSAFGMVLCASNADHTAVENGVTTLIACWESASCLKAEQVEPEPENKIAKKIFRKVAPDLKTDATGQESLMERRSVKLWQVSLCHN
jgi:hypothetical protein